MLENFQTEDFNISPEPYGSRRNVFFATSKNSAFSKSNYAIKKLTFYDTANFRANEELIKRLMQSVRSASILKPEAVSISQLEILLLYEKQKCDLSDLVDNYAQKARKFTPDEIKKFLKQTTYALEELENKYIPHTNIKPKNILITLQGDYKFTDVGVQSMNEEFDFRAPELTIGKGGSTKANFHKCDVFSLGMVLVQMLTLKSSKELLPLKGSGADNVSRAREILGLIEHDYGREMLRIVQGMLEFSDNKRKSMVQMKDDIEDFIGAFSEAVHKNINSVEEKLVADLFSTIVEKLQQKDQDFSFFLKFNFNSFSNKIQRNEFMEAMHRLDIRIDEEKSTPISRVLDPDNSGFYDLSGLKKEMDLSLSKMKVKNLGDRFDGRSEMEDKEVRSILDEIYNFCRKNNLNFLEICKGKDFYKKGTILFDDFKLIHRQINLTFNENDFDIIRRKYDRFSTNEISYEMLASDMEMPYKASNENTSSLMKQFYLRIREIYNTISDFFSKVDLDGNKIITRDEFLSIIKNLRLNFTSTEMNAIWIQLDKSNNGKVFPLNFRTVFMPFIDEDMRNMLVDLYRCLDGQNLTFMELIKSFNKSGYIQFPRLMDALKSINPSFTPRDMSFLLSEFDIRNNQEISVQTLEQSITEKARQLNLQLSPKHLQKSLSSKALLKDSSQASQAKFYDRALNFKKSPGELAFNRLQEKITKFKKSEVMNVFKNVDRTNDRLLDFQEFVYLVNTFDNQLDQNEKRQLFDFLDIDEDRKVSSAEFFGRIYPVDDSGSGRSASFEEKYDFARKFIKEVNNCLDLRRKNPEEHFSSFDGSNMPNVDFRFAVSQLGINIDNIADQFINSIVVIDDPNSINLPLFFQILNQYKNLIAKSPQVILNKFELAKNFKAINDAMALQNTNYETLFAKLDRFNQNQISLPEFKRAHFNPNLTPEDGQNIFNRFDANNDGKITLAEFRRAVSSENSSFDREFLTQGFFESISILLQEKRYTLQQLFGKNTINGRLPVDYFFSGLQFLGYDRERHSEKLKSVISVLNQNMERNQLNYSLLETLYERYKKTSWVITEEEKIKLKGFTRFLKQTLDGRKLTVAKVFESRDKFDTGTISSEELKHILLDELYMEASPDLFLFVKSMSPSNDGKVSLGKLKAELNETPSQPSTPSQHIPPEQFFPRLLPLFQNNPLSVLGFLFENKSSLPRSEFETKLSSLNMFPPSQIQFVYTRLDTRMSGFIERAAVEGFLFNPRPSAYGPNPPNQGFFGSPQPNPSQGGFYQGYPTQNQPQPGYNSSNNIPQAQQPQPGYNSFNNMPQVQSTIMSQPPQMMGNYPYDQGSNLVKTQYVSEVQNTMANFPHENAREIANFVQGAKNMLRREFNSIDRGSSGYLPVWEIKKVFQNNGYQTCRADDLEAFGLYYGICDNKNIQYNRMIEICDQISSQNVREGTEYQSSMEMEVLSRIRGDVLRLNLNLPMILQKYDKAHNQMIYIREFSNELASKGIILKKDDLKILLNRVRENEMNQINYIEMSNYIMSNNNVRSNSPMQMRPSSFNVPPPMNSNNRLFDTIKEKLKHLYASLGISLKALFRQIDLDNDNYISYKEFSDCLERKLQMPGIPFQQIEECFKRFDDDQDYKISYFEFSKHILDLGDTDHKKLLLRLKKQLLEKNNEEKDLLKLFKDMDKDHNGWLSFVELKEALNKMNVSFTDTEIEAIYRYFDPEEKERISYDHFVEVLSEDHLNLAPLRKKVEAMLKDKNQSLIAFFRSLNSTGDDKFLKRKEFGDFLKKLGFTYDNDQEEELFETFDHDKDYLVSFEEFEAVISDSKKLDPSNTLKRLRRYIFSQKINLLQEFEAYDRQRSGQISFFEFNKVLKRFSDLSPNEIEILFKSFSEGKQEFIDYREFWEALVENNIDLEPIKSKFDELCERWKVDYDGLFEQFDQSQKGFLTWLDFDQMMLSLQLRLPIEELQEYFNAFDINKNGKLTQAEFLAVLAGKKPKNRKMMMNTDSPVWKRNSKLYQPNFEFKPAFKDRKQFHLNPVQTNFEDDFEETVKNQRKIQKASDFDDDSNSWEKESFVKKPAPGKERLRASINQQEELWKPDDLIEAIKRQAYLKKVRLFPLFIDFDKTRNVLLSNPSDLATIIQDRLDLRQVPWPDIEGLFQHYSPDQGRTMNFIRLLMDIEDPGTVLVDQIKYIMKIQNMTLDDIFNNVDKDRDSKWNIREFASLNQILKIGLEKEEINQIFTQWDLNGNGYISIKELEKVFNVVPQKTSMHPSNFPKNNQGDLNRDYQQKYLRTKNFLRTLILTLSENGIKTAAALCETSENQVPRATFLKCLSRLKVNTRDPEANEFISNLAVENPNFIELRELDYLIRNYSEIFNDNSIRQTEFRDNRDPGIPKDIAEIVEGLKEIVEEKGFEMFSGYDRNNSGFISEKDLYHALTSELEDCEEFQILIRYLSKNGRVPLSELRRVFGMEERGGPGFDGLKMQSMGVKSDFQKAKVLSEADRRFMESSVEELRVAFMKQYPGRKIDDFVNYFFMEKDKSLTNLTDHDRFIQNCRALGTRLNERDLNSLFSLLDINNSGTITRNEILLLLNEPEPDQRPMKNKEMIRLPDELKKEIQVLFKEVDKDNSGFVEKNELCAALMQVGINPTNQEIDEYMSKFDDDGDGKISFAEFNHIFEQKLKSDMMVMDELVGKLRAEFKKADVRRDRLLNMAQLR